MFTFVLLRLRLVAIVVLWAAVAVVLVVREVPVPAYMAPPNPEKVAERGRALAEGSGRQPH